MTRVAAPTLILVLLFGIGAMAQSDSSSGSAKQTDAQKQTKAQHSAAQQPSSQSNTQSTDNSGNLPNAPSTATPSGKSAADQFPFPGDQEKGAQGIPKPSSQTGSNSQSNSQSSDNPDDILNAPMTPPRSDKPAAEQFPFPEQEEKGSYSSSKDTQGDIGPPSGDSTHPGADITKAPDDVMETKPWNPHEADKDVEVGTFYFRLGNYKAAEARFRDALTWQDNHAEAMYRLGATLQKEGRLLEARMYYQSYLKILPKGQFADDSRKAIEKMNSAEDKEDRKSAKKVSTSPPL
jgi:tetratricopeptide (TPR) repeat protein